MPILLCLNAVTGSHTTTGVNFFFLKKSAPLWPLKELTSIAALWGHRLEMHASFYCPSAWKSRPYGDGGWALAAV